MMIKICKHSAELIAWTLSCQTPYLARVIHMAITIMILRERERSLVFTIKNCDCVRLGFTGTVNSIDFWFSTFGSDVGMASAQETKKSPDKNQTKPTRTSWRIADSVNTGFLIESSNAWIVFFSSAEWIWFMIGHITTDGIIVYDHWRHVFFEINLHKFIRTVVDSSNSRQSSLFFPNRLTEWRHI